MALLHLTISAQDSLQTTDYRLQTTDYRDYLAVDSKQSLPLLCKGRPWTVDLKGFDPNFANLLSLMYMSAAGPLQLQELIQRIINLTAALAFIVLTVMLVYAGVRFITSNGEPKNIQLAQQTATWAIIGIVLLVGAWLILRLIEAFTGVPVTKFCIGFPGSTFCP